MTPDPQGYYARLGVSPNVEQAAIVAAFRREARRLHPDVPGTGDAGAFVALKAAYDVLGDPGRRAAYDRAARSSLPRAPAASFAPAAPYPNFGDVPWMVWVSLIGVAVVAVISAVTGLTGGRDTPVPPQQTAAVRSAAAPESSPRIIRLIGPWTHYVTPGDGPAILWQPDASGRRLLPTGKLPPFTPVRAIGALPEHGLIMIALGGGGHGFVDGVRLVPGGAAEARRAFCTDQAGAPPGQAEILGQRGAGTAKLVIQNRGEEPAVVKLRDMSERTEAAIYVSPGVTATVVNIPSGPWHVDFATGEMWSRACRIFAAGMRAQRMPGVIEQGGLLTVPQALSGEAPLTDIPDQVFTQD